MLLLALAACGGGGDPGLVLDGTPFDADVEGVVDDVNLESITIDGRSHALADEIVVFSAATLERITLAGRRDHYVQAGLDDGEVVWVAAVGGVLPTDPPAVLFEDHVAAVGDTVRFRGGFVVDLAPGVDVPVGETVMVRIDPGAHEVIAVEDVLR